jgi:putative spermidine/putrescine transport system permease protein
MIGIVPVVAVILTTIGVYVLLGPGPTIGLIFLLGLAVLVAVRRKLGSVVVFVVGAVYFILPLFATLQWSFQARPAMAAYTNSLADPNFVGSLLYSFVVAIVTIALSIALIVPTAYWVRLKAPRLRPYVEFVTLLPFVIPPVILAFGLIRVYSRPPLPLTNLSFGSDLLLVAAYVVLSLPYMYRAVDTGLRSIDVRTLTEAAQSQGAGWFTILWRVIFPNLRVALLSGAFLTVAIVIGEYTIGSFLSPKGFGPYLSLLGNSLTYEPAAVSIISFALTWAAMGVIVVIGRGSRGRVQLVGTH